MGAYDPEGPAKRPGGKPNNAPKYRILVHRKYEAAWNQIVERVGMQQAQQFWDHVAYTPGIKDPIANTCFLRGKAGVPKGKGFSKTIHYELSSMARINTSIAMNIKRHRTGTNITLFLYLASITRPTDQCTNFKKHTEVRGNQLSTITKW